MHGILETIRTTEDAGEGDTLTPSEEVEEAAGGRVKKGFPVGGTAGQRS